MNLSWMYLRFEMRGWFFTENPSFRFEGAKKKIASKYDEIEKLLIEAFVTAHEKEDTARMKEIAAILSHFKGYTQCVDAFIEQSQMVYFWADCIVLIYLVFIVVVVFIFVSLCCESWFSNFSTEHSSWEKCLQRCYSFMSEKLWNYERSIPESRASHGKIYSEYLSWQASGNT